MSLSKRLVESPDVMRVEYMVLHAGAQTCCFSFINDDTIIASDRTHLFIFNSLKAFKRTGDVSSFEDYGCWFEPRRPKKAELMQAAELVTSGGMGDARRQTCSGRIWAQVLSKYIGKITAISIWAPHDHPGASRRVSSIIHLFRRLIKDEPIYVEFVDSLEPTLYNHADQTLSKSIIDPTLTPDQIAEILKKAHTSPFLLTAKELEVVHELRPRSTKVRPSGGMTQAELNHRSRMSESVRKARFAAWVA